MAEVNITKRVSHVDIAKGITILLVALFHSNLKTFIPEVIKPMSLFRLPLFFFLSGVFFSASSKPNTFYRKKSDALLKPYFVTLISLYIVSVSSNTNHLGHLVWKLAGIIYGNGPTIEWVPLWFLTHLFAVYCVVYMIFRYTGFQNKSSVLKCSILVAMMAIGTYWIDLFWYPELNLFGKDIKLPGLPFGLDIVLVSSCFFIVGALLKNSVISFRPKIYRLFFSVLFFIIIATQTDAHIDLNKRICSFPMAATLGATCGIYTIVTLSFFLDKLPFVRRALLSFGRGSLFVLIFHQYIGSQVYQALSSSGTNELDLTCAVLAFLSSITIPLIIRFVISNSDVLSLLYLPLQSNKLLHRIRKAYR